MIPKNDEKCKHFFYFFSLFSKKGRNVGMKSKKPALLSRFLGCNGGNMPKSGRIHLVIDLFHHQIVQQENDTDTENNPDDQIFHENQQCYVRKEEGECVE